MHKGVYAMGDDVIKLCEAQFEARRLRANSEDLPPALAAALDGGSSRYVHFCMQYVTLLRDAGVRPLLVFDGAALPAKGGTEVDRFAYVAVFLVNADA